MELIEIGQGQGQGKTLYAIKMRDSCFAQEYMEKLDSESQKQFLALIDRIIEHGPPNNTRKFRHIGEQVYELKIHRGGRILSFFPDSVLPKSLILTHGFHKSAEKKLAREKERAVNLRNEFLEYIKQNKQIKIIYE